MDGYLGWWCIPGSEMLDMLRRAAAGEDPDVIFAEAWANACHHARKDD